MMSLTTKLTPSEQRNKNLVKSQCIRSKLSDFKKKFLMPSIP